MSMKITILTVAFSMWIKNFKLGETQKIPASVRFNDIQHEGFERWGYMFKWNREKNEVTRICPQCLR